VTTDAPWPVKTREHVDLWLHGFALIGDDSTRVPFFRRGYRDQMVVLHNRANVTTSLEANRDQLRSRLAINRGLINAQFIPLYFGSWDDMRRAVSLFVNAEGDPRRVAAEAQGVVALLANYFPSGGDRDWLRVFTNALEDERARFYHGYWTDEQRQRAAVIAAVDSLWQRVERPKLQRFLNNTQQATGDFLLSLPLDGEGRTILEGKRANAIAVTFPDQPATAAEAVYVFAHETVGNVVAGAVRDNTTPAEQRAGLSDRYITYGAVRGGALLLQRAAPELARDYARYYLRAAGITPSGDPMAALAAAFPLPDAILTGITRQLDVVMGGI
jgi:hypothetical protein